MSSTFGPLQTYHLSITGEDLEGNENTGSFGNGQEALVTTIAKTIPIILSLLNMIANNSSCWMAYSVLKSPLALILLPFLTYLRIRYNLLSIL